MQEKPHSCFDDPVHADGGIAILKGNLAPNGSVVKKGAVASHLMHLKGPAKDFERVFAKARKAGLHVVAHAGEDVESWSIKDALHLLKAERIGHGITAAQDAELVKEMAKTQVPFEICPTSNTFTKKIVSRIEDHPIRALYDAGCFVTVNTDDPAFFGVSLIDEYWNLYSKLNFTLDEIKTIILNGFKASFISDSAKKKYTSAVNKAWKEWFAANPDAKE